MIILDDEDEGKFPDRGEIEALVKLALVCGTFAREGDRDMRLAAHLVRQRRADRGSDAFAANPRAGEIHLWIEEMHMAAASAREAGALAEDLGGHRLEVDRFGDCDMVRAVRRGDEVIGCEMGAHA